MSPALLFAKHSFTLNKRVLLQKQNRGFFVKDDYTPQADTKQELSEELDLPEYYQLAEDWLQDEIESEVTELFLMKRYNLTKSQLSTVLAGASVRDGLNVSKVTDGAFYPWQKPRPRWSRFSASGWS